MKTTPDPLQDPRFSKLVSALRAQPAPEPQAGFMEQTLARARQPVPRKLTFSVLAARAAAVLALLLGAGVWFIRAPVPVAQAPTPVDVLMAAQRADGSWAADAQNSPSRYDTSVTALALLALLRSDAAPLAGAHAEAIRAGMTHLLSQQNADGRFGEDFSGAGFTQYLAGMAVQAAAKLPDADPAWVMASARAAPHLPTGVQMAKLNSSLAHPENFPVRWADAGGPVTCAALQMLGP